MCGIFGWKTSRDWCFDKKELELMGQSLSHRGPDDSGIYLDDSIRLALGHSRLSIIDLSENGHQPMVDTITGGVLNYNGEIYNYKPIKKELESLGHSFNSKSDTEVLLIAFRQWGVECLEKIVGMYAFGYWHSESGSLYLVRDPMGIKPLYYWPLPDKRGVLFASEIKAFTGLPGFTKTIDKTSLSQYLEFGYTFASSNTIFSDVKKVPPGHFLKIDSGNNIVIERYFKPNVGISGDTDRRDLEHELFETLDTVVKEQLIADVPVGLLLSGGIDSSIIAAMASRSTRVRTFSFGFEESDIDERKKARLVSEHIGSDHQEFMISPKQILNNLPETVRCMDDLFADWGVFSTKMMYRECRDRDIKVVLVGEGADELFGGYWGRFSPALKGNSDWKISWRLFQMHRKYIARRYGSTYWKYRRTMKKHLQETGGDLFNAIRMFESVEQLSNNFEMKVDKASMSESIEARVPYLDSRIAQLAYQIPQQFLIDENEGTKSILRSMATRFKLLPDEIITQKKFGISLPSSWMESSIEFQGLAKEVVLDENGWAHHLGLADAMNDYFMNNRKGYPFPSSLSIFRNLAWKLMLLGMWSDCYGIDPRHTYS